MRPTNAILGTAFAIVMASILGADRLHAAQLDEAHSAFKRGDYRHALTLFRPLAESGDPVAQVYLGIMFRNGLGVQKYYAESGMSRSMLK